MVEIILDQSDDLFTSVKKIKEASSKDINVVISDSFKLANLISFKLLLREAKAAGKRITFNAQEARVASIIEALASQTGKEKKPPEPGTFVVGKDIAEELGQGSKGEGQKEPDLKVGARRRFRGRVNFSTLLSARFLRSRGALVLGSTLGFFLLLGGSFSLFYFNFPTAVVQLKVNPETLVKSLEIVASPSVQEVDTEARVIPAKSYELFEKGSEATKTTGLETVGGKATGEVTIFNKTDEKKEFGEKTKIVFGRTEGEDLIYFLDKSVEVSSREASTSAEGVGQSTITYIFGRKDVSVTAEKIGPDYNLKKGETFIVDDHPTSNFIAQNDADFSGGSKKEITVVTSEDHERLLKSLLERLSEAIKKRAKDELTREDLVLEEKALQITTVSQTFLRDVGEEAEEVTLNLEVKGMALVYSKRDLTELLSNVLKDVVPERFSLTEDGQNISVDGVIIDEGNLKFYGKVKGYAIPKLDTENLKESIKGKRLEVVQAYLSALTNVESYEIDLFPVLPGPFRALPNKKENITVNVTYSD